MHKLKVFLITIVSAVLMYCTLEYESTDTIVRKIARLQCKTIIRDSSRTSEAYVLKIAVEAGRY